jgi:hypothetical protein
MELVSSDPRRMRRPRHLVRMSENRNAFWFLVEKPKGNRPQGRLSLKKNYIKDELKNRIPGRRLNLSGSG